LINTNATLKKIDQAIILLTGSVNLPLKRMVN